MSGDTGDDADRGGRRSAPPGGGRTGEGGDPWAFEDWVARRARRSPDATAVVDAATGRRLDYRALDRRVAAVATELAALGVERGDHIGSLLGTRVAAAELLHAAVRLGAVPVPVDPTLPPDRIADRLGRADVAAAVCGSPFRDRAVAAADRSPYSVPLASVDADPELATIARPDSGMPADASDGSAESGGSSLRGGNGRGVDPVARPLDDPVLIVYTSGTTGDPKPVVLTAGNLLASAVGSALRLGVVPGDRWFCELPAWHVGGLAPFVRSALYGTAAVVQRRDPAVGFDPGRTLENLRAYDATAVSLVPTQLSRLLDAGSLPGSLRFVLLGGGPAPDDLIDRCADRDVPVCPTYGTTETASQIATARPDEATDHVGTVGRPLATTTVRVVEDGEPCPPGRPGELVVDGPTVTPGYYDDPDRTRRAFGPHGLHTGDRGYRDRDGRLWVLGRADDRIVTGGETVDPETVAGALRSVDGVAAAAVVGLDDPEWGQRVGALVVAESGDDENPESDGGGGAASGEDPGVTPAAVVAACRDRLAAHERPRTVAVADALPRTVSGTVDRSAVRERLHERGVDVDPSDDPATR